MRLGLESKERQYHAESCRPTDRRMCEKLYQLLAVGRWFPPGTPGSSTRKLISSSFHRLDMNLAVAEALNPPPPKKKAVLTKFQQNEQVMQNLKPTDGRTLVEASWGDSYWGGGAVSVSHQLT